MGDTFCFTVSSASDVNISTFQAADGEEYNVKYNGNVIAVGSAGGFGGCHSKCECLTIKWKKTSSKFIKVLRYDKVSHSRISKNISFVENNTFATLNFRGIGFVVPPPPQPFWSDKPKMPFKFRNDNHPDELLFVITVTPHIPHADDTNLNSETLRTVSVEEEQAIATNTDQLLLDMQSLFITGKFSDVVLTDGSKEIRAHKTILSTRSSTFAGKFKQSVRKSQENPITITDITFEVLQEMLYFMYTGSVRRKDSKMVRDLYVAAVKYNMKDLRGICSELLKSIDMDNILDTLLLAYMYEDKALKEAALRFITSNYSKLKVLDNWYNFIKEYKELGLEVLSFVVDNK